MIMEIIIICEDCTERLYLTDEYCEEGQIKVRPEKSEYSITVKIDDLKLALRKFSAK